MEKNRAAGGVPVMTAGLIVTHACNLNCVYCYERNKGNRFMALETAQSILRPLLMTRDEPLMVNLMGGEPMMAFPMIRQLVEWVGENRSIWKRDCHFFGSTNGTLLDAPMKRWLHDNRDVITLALSYDGMPTAQNENRSLSADRIDLDFFRENWPDQRVQMTVNENTVGRMAEGVIYLTELGFPVNASVAYEEREWSDDSIRAYLDQLLALMDYYLEHPSVPMIYQFEHPLEDYAYAMDHPSVQYQQCGAGCGYAMFDDDGSCYPCHMLSSLVVPADRLAAFKGMDMSGLSFQDPRCQGCPYTPACSTCAGCNLLHRGDVAVRDETHCKIQQLEVKVCMRYYTSKMAMDPSSGSRALIDAIRKLNARDTAPDY